MSLLQMILREKTRFIYLLRISRHDRAHRRHQAAADRHYTRAEQLYNAVPPSLFLAEEQASTWFVSRKEPSS